MGNIALWEHITVSFSRAEKLSEDICNTALIFDEYERVKNIVGNKIAFFSPPRLKDIITLHIKYFFPQEMLEMLVFRLDFGVEHLRYGLLTE